MIHHDIKQHVHQIKEKIDAIARLHNREPNSIQLLAVSKGQSATTIREAFSAGIPDFGENYCQAALAKMGDLSDLQINWHFIGAIQSNKAALIAKHFSWVESVSRESIARLLSEHRPQDMPLLQVCIQVNLDDEGTKSGIRPDELLPLALYISQLPNINLRGLMTIPKIEPIETLQYEKFLRLTILLEQCNQALGLSMDTLSMGMSDDWEQAVAAGSTMLRIGRAIFGERDIIA